MSSRPATTSSTSEHAARAVIANHNDEPGSAHPIAVREPDQVLEDGSRHNVYKRFFTASQRAEELGGGEILHEGRWFVAVAS